MAIVRAPSPSATFVGRQREIDRLETALARVNIALISGVAGVGKSALAYVAAARFGGPVAYRRAQSDQPLAALIDDLRRQLAHGPVPEAESDPERIADLCERLDATQALVVLDDLHRLPPETREDLVHALSQSLRRGRVIATSREIVPLPPGGGDWLELRLLGLAEEEARALWSSLDELYGAQAGFEAAWKRARGNPFLLRRAHAGGLDEADPISASVAALPPDEREVAGALALADGRLPRSILDGLSDGERVRAALRRLRAQMIVEVDGAGACAVHDLFRDALLASLSVTERSAMHERLASLLAGAADLDPVVRTRDVCRHLRALDRHEQAGAYLVEHATEMIRHGAAAELVRGFEAIPPPRRTREVRIARARTLARVMHLGCAYHELEQLVSEAAGQELKLAFGQTAMLRAELDVAREQIQEVLEDVSAPAAVRTRAMTALALVRTCQGEGALARRFLREAEAFTGDSLLSGALAFCCGFSAWLDEEDAEAEVALVRAMGHFRDVPGAYRARVMAPAAFTGILARLGKIEQAEAMLRLSENELVHSEDALLRGEVRAQRCCLMLERGDRLAVLEELHALAATFERGNYKLGALWAAAYEVRALYWLGRRAEARALAETTVREAEQCGVIPVVRSCERAKRVDPLAQLARAEMLAASPKPGEAARGRALVALASAAAGTRVRFEPPAQPGYALERAIAHLVMATLWRLEGDKTRAQKAVDAALREAAAENVDADLVHELFAAAGSVRQVTASERRMVATPGDAKVLVDARTHELHAGDRRVSLRSRPVLRRLLYALAAHPGRVMDKEELALALWSVPYNPLVHDNALKVNVLRLRGIVRAIGIDIELGEMGYRLAVPAGFVYVDAL